MAQLPVYFPLRKLISVSFWRRSFASHYCPDFAQSKDVLSKGKIDRTNEEHTGTRPKSTYGFKCYQSRFNEHVKPITH